MRSTPTNSIALDGFCAAAPEIDLKGKRVNFNHHEFVDRLATRATCAQVLGAIRGGLFDFFNDKEPINIYVNDCDEDVSLAVFLLTKSYLAENCMNPLLNRLVFVEDMMDTTAGTYALPENLPILGQMAWIFEPYRRFRVTGQIDKREPVDFAGVIDAVGERIMAHIMGNGKSIEVDTEYEVLHSNRHFTMVKEIGGNARTGMFADGIKAYVTIRERTDGHWAYTVGKKSQFIDFDIVAIVNLLNEIECADTLDKWGGSPLVAGSPRVSGSQQDPKKLFELITEAICKIHLRG